MPYWWLSLWLHCWWREPFPTCLPTLTRKSHIHRQSLLILYFLLLLTFVFTRQSAPFVHFVYYTSVVSHSDVICCGTWLPYSDLLSRDPLCSPCFMPNDVIWRVTTAILSRRLMPPHVICVGGACILYIGSKGNSTCNSSSLLTLGLSMVQRRQMEALSRGISKLWYCREIVCGLCGSVNTARVLVHFNKPWWSRRRPGNQAVHFVCFQPSLLPRLCRLPLPQTPTVPANLLLLMEYLDTVSP